MLYVSNQIFVNVKVGDVVLPLGGGQLRKLTIVESCNQFLPTLEIELLDQFGLLFSEPSIYDGVKISVALSTSQRLSESDWRTFLCYPRKVYTNKGGYIVSIVGLLYHPDYILGTTYKSLDATSYNVAQRIAQECGFSFEGDSTNDKQVWINYGLSRAKFLREVTNHAWSNNSSAYVTSVTRDGKLLFYDISKRRRSAIKWKFQAVTSLRSVEQKSEDVIFIPEDDMTVDFGSDFMNATSGYGISQRFYDFVNGKERFESPSEYSAYTSHVMINKDLKATRFVYGDVDVGNFHNQYNMAKIQGYKFRSTYSTQLTLLAPVPRAANLLDRATFSYFDRPKNRTGAVVDGAYFIERITHSITPESYIINYGLIREGINSINKVAGLK